MRMEDDSSTQEHASRAVARERWIGCVLRMGDGQLTMEYGFNMSRRPIGQVSGAKISQFWGRRLEKESRGTTIGIL